MKKYNCILSVILIVLACLIFGQTKNMLAIKNGSPGPGIWPRILAVIMILLALGLFIQTFHLKTAWSERLIDIKKAGVLRVFILFGTFITFGVALNYLGFIISTLLFVPGVMHVLGEKREKFLLTVSISITIFIYLVFEKILNVVLPQPFFI